jgi:SAM-dependent methyltransferase
MMRLACTTETYEVLYAKWLEKPGELLDFAHFDVGGDYLLDLCGGTGAVAKEAIRRGQEVAWLLDLNPRCDDEHVICVRGRAEEAISAFGALRYTPKFNLVACRQAIGYLDLAQTFAAVERLLKPGGRFVLNAFRRPKWSLKTYRHGGVRYVEASGFLGRRVLHLQAMRGDYDVSMFRWHTREEIVQAGSVSFNLVDQVVSERSMRFLFQKPEVGWPRRSPNGPAPRTGHR